MNNQAFQRKLRRRPADVLLPPSGIHIIESHHAESFHMEMDRWPFHKVCWVPIGTGLLELPTRRHPIHAGTILILPAGNEHRFVDNPKDPLTLVIACCAPEAVRRHPVVARAFDAHIEESRTTLSLEANNRFQLVQAQECFKGMLREQSSALPGADSETYAYLLHLLVLLRRGFSREAQHRGERAGAAMEAALSFLEVNFHKPVSLRDLADLSGYSSRRFTDLFKAHTGMTLVAYLNVKRINHAKERLAETGNIAYACYEAGYQDLTYFYRVFKKQTGRTPGAYLKSM